MTKETLHTLWIEASPLNAYRFPFPGLEVSRWEMAAYHVMRPAHRLAEKARAAWRLCGGGNDMVPGELFDRRYRVKALLLLLILPVRWYDPHFPLDADDVLSYDGHEWNGGEQTCWEATFIAVRAGWRPGRVHIYRDGGP